MDPGDTDSRDPTSISSELVQAVHGDASGLAETHSLPGGPVPDSGAACIKPTTWSRPTFSITARISGNSRASRAATASSMMTPYLYHHAAARRAAGRVLPHASHGPEPARQHDRVARRALRRARLRQTGRLRIPQGEARLRAVSDRGADQSEHGDLAATHAVEPDGLAGDPRCQLACDPDRELDSFMYRRSICGRSTDTCRN